jgi:hypothetical protein
MTNDHTSDPGDTADSGPNERRESFPVTGAVSAHLTTRSGDVSVTHGDDATLTVRLRASGNAAAQLLASSEIHYDESSKTLTVVSAGACADVRAGAPLGLGFGRRQSMIGTSMRDVDIVVVVPRSSDLEVKTKSGDCAIHGESGVVDVATASGDVVIEDAVSLNVRTASGDIMVGRGRNDVTASSASGDVVVKEAPGTTKVQSASGDVRLLSSGGVTNIATASGDVALDATGPGKVNVRSASGDVQVAVQSGLEIDVVARSVSGSLTSAIPLDGSTGGGEGEPLNLSVATVSGDVRIARA